MLANQTMAWQLFRYLIFRKQKAGWLSRARAPLFSSPTLLHVRKSLLANQKCDKFRGDADWLVIAGPLFHPPIIVIKHAQLNIYKSSNQITFYRFDDELEPSLLLMTRIAGLGPLIVQFRTSWSGTVFWHELPICSLPLDNVNMNSNQNTGSPYFLRLLSSII